MIDDMGCYALGKGRALHAHHANHLCQPGMKNTSPTYVSVRPDCWWAEIQIKPLCQLQLPQSRQRAVLLCSGRYPMPVCLIIGVDSENRSRVLLQAVLQNEQTASFEYLLRHVVKLCGRSPQVHESAHFFLPIEAVVTGTCRTYPHAPPPTFWFQCYLRCVNLPQVIITDADAAMLSAVASVIPRALHLFCLWHVKNKVRKQCADSMSGNGDEKEGIVKLLQVFTRAALAPTENVSSVDEFLSQSPNIIVHGTNNVGRSGVNF